jgi:hypothetical protein
MRKTRTLVIAPFGAAGERVLDTVRSALRDLSVEVFRFDNIAPGALWANAITGSKPRHLRGVSIWRIFRRHPSAC